MLRIALIDIFMFSLPFLIYGAYMLAAKGAAPTDVWQDAPVLWLLAAGCGLLLITMATLIQFSGASPVAPIIRRPSRMGSSSRARSTDGPDDRA